jgi:hypothetical protein
MSRRIEIELTSERPDGTWTWRAAGAREPKGDLTGDLLFEGAKVGDVVRADAEFDVDGIAVIAVLPPKGARKEPERLEIIGPPRREELVTSTLAKGGKGRGDRRDRDGPRDRKGRPGRDRGRDGGDRRDRPSRGEGRRPSRPPADDRPKPKRLRPKRTHRSAVLKELPPEQQPIAEQVLRGGLPAVRAAVEKQNEEAKSAGQPPIKAEPLLAMAEQLVPRLRAAEWRDRAEAAAADVDELDLRDLRSVVVAADTAARDDESRKLADQLRTALSARVEQAHGAWMAELASTLAEGRIVRALRLSSRPPKAGAPLPTDLAARLAEAAGAALTDDIAQDRWATILDALALSPVRQSVTPAGIPAQPSDELLAEVKRVSMQVPEIAARFGIEPTAAPKRPRPPRKGPGTGKPKAAKGEAGPRAKPVPPPPDLAATSSPPADPAPTASPAAAPNEAPATEIPTTADPAAAGPDPDPEPEPSVGSEPTDESAQT